MKKFIFAMMFCLVAVCGVQAQEGAMKFNGFTVEYKGDNAQAKEAAEALKAVMPEVAKKFGWVVGREYLMIDYNGGVTFVSGENGAKKTEGQIFAFDQNTDGMYLGASMEINKSNYDISANIHMQEGQNTATFVFNTQEVVNIVTVLVPNAADDANLMKVYNTLMQYPDIKLGMSITADFAAMM
ncbi:MAG: DUF4923 family protein [Alistipes sp.]|nr:DUF4923 family protein [Alistipes sp.]